MILDFLYNWNALVWLHVLGAVIGAGAAFVADILFAFILRNKRISNKELLNLKRISNVVWLGIFILIVSGLLLFSIAPSVILDSPRMLAKLTIVAILVANGILFHFIHLPELKKYADNQEVSFAKQLSKKYSLFLSGGISIISWISVIALGILHNLSYTYGTIMLIYLALVFFALTAALSFREFELRDLNLEKKVHKTTLVLIAITTTLALIFSGLTLVRGLKVSDVPEEEHDHNVEEHAHD